MPTIQKMLALNTNRELLFQQILMQYPNAVYRTSEFSPTEPYIEVTHDNVDDIGLGEIIQNHNPETLTTGQLESTQATSAKTGLQALMTGLHSLSANDKGYVVLARIMARNDGANNATIIGITTRAQATTYVTNRANWLAVPSAARPMLGDILESHAVSISATIAFLTG